jgi:beta-1,4-mannosyltransferase
VLYDKATKKFGQISMEDRHALFMRIGLKAKDQNETLFTKYDSNSKEYKLKEDRPVFIISSTSYTPDENFGLMISALDKLQQKILELT